MVYLKSKLSSKVDERKETDILLPNYDEGIEDQLKENLEEDIKQAYKQIDNLILSEYVKEQNRDSYSQLVKIIWLLKNDIILSEIYRGLSEMASKSGTMTSLLLYHYAKRQVSKTLTGYYFQKDLFFQEKDQDKNKRIIKIEQELKKINDIGVDVAYAFWYKDKLEKMVNNIIQFVSKNKKYIGFLRS
jgi:hypothetical protein